MSISYAAVGSGAGIAAFSAKQVDFGASDVPTTASEQAAAGGGPSVQVPVALGAEDVVYNLNLPAGHGLHLTGPVLAEIYLGQITHWNDPAITALNPGLSLPDARITVVHRSDGSGTTYIWTDFLSKVSDEWKNKVGKGTSVNWPVGLGGKGNEGVAGLVKQTPNAIGYIELLYAAQNGIAFGKVQNAAGKFIKADLASVTAAAAGAAKDMPADFRVSITNAPGATSYPVASFTWLLIPAHIEDAAKRDAIKGFLKWMLTDGQKYNEGLTYAQLPKSVVEKELKAIALVQ